MLPMTAAFVSAGKDAPVRAGLWLALACLCKQAALVTGLPVGFLLFEESLRKPAREESLVRWTYDTVSSVWKSSRKVNLPL